MMITKNHIRGKYVARCDVCGKEIGNGWNTVQAHDDALKNGARFFGLRTFCSKEHKQAYLEKAREIEKEILGALAVKK